MAAGQLDVEVFQEPDARMSAGVGAGRVAGELEEVEAMRDRERAGEVGDEDEARLQGCDQERLAALVVAGDLAPELANTGLQLPPREVDVPQARRPYDASSSRYRSARRSMSRL